MNSPHPSANAFVSFVSVANMMRLVHKIGTETVLLHLVDRIEKEFLRWEAFDKSPRVASHSTRGAIELMPISDGGRYSFKYVNGHPLNTADGLQTVAAFGVLADVCTGYPVLITEMTMLTALRTAATSAMAAKYLAPKGSRTMSLIGNGAQSEFQALAMKVVLGIEKVKLYDVDRSASEKTARNLFLSGLAVEICSSAQSAVEGAQIITTATADKRKATILSDNMVGAGVHINAIGGDCPGKTELHPDVLRRSVTFVEYAPQTWIEGEIQQMDRSYPVTELWNVIAGNAPGRTSEKQITVFDGVGFAIEDFASLVYIYENVKDTDFCDQLDLIADPDDPRDLFGMLRRYGDQR